MAKRDKPTQQPAERPEFPKPLVRLKSEAGGYGCDVQMVGDSDAEGAAKDAGYVALDVPDVPADFVEFPKWVYHADGRRQVVYSEDDLGKLDGFTPEVPAQTEGEPATKEVPPPVAQATALDTRNRPPVPADRG